PLVSVLASLLLAIVPAAQKLNGGTANASDPEAGSHWLQTNWQSEQGLQSNTIQAILQTRDGYIWLGTKRGLVRFDGLNFTVFNRTQMAGLRDSSVFALCETADGTLWIGGERGGVTRYRAGKFMPLKMSNGAADQWVHSIQPSKHAEVLIRTVRQVIAVRDSTTTVLMPNHGVLQDTISALMEDRQGELWLSTLKSGLFRFHDEALSRWTHFTTREGLSSNRISTVHEDRRSNVWVGANGALSRYTSSGFETFRFAEPSPFNEVYIIREDLEGGIWAGCWGRLLRWKDGKFTSFPLENGGSGTKVLALAVDRENNIWVGTHNYGLYRLNSARFFTYTTEQGLSNNSVKSVLGDSKGRLWVGADVGLNVLEDGRFRALPGAISRANVRSLAEDRDGNIWVGGENRLFRTKNGKYEELPLQQPGSPPHVTTSLWAARDGTLWIGSRMGLLRLKNGALTRITSSDGLSSDFVRAVIEASDGAIWIATTHGGLNRLKDGKITAFTVENGLSSNDIYSLYEDTEGVLWIGTMDDGFCRWKNSSLACFDSSDGLFNDGAYQILEDRQDNLWIGGSGGIYRVAKRDVEARAAGKATTIGYIAYGRADGMKSVECRGGHQPTSGKTQDGRLWFATIRGLVVIEPARLNPNPVPPPVVIEEIKVNGQHYDSSVTPEVPLGDGGLEVRYTGLSFVDSTKVRFKYRLTGFDRDWVDAGNRRTATYTNLPPGRFEFQVIACNNDGVWNKAGSVFAITLRPPYYRSHWFFALLAASALGLGFGVHRYKVARMESRFSAVLAERTRIAREIHDTIMQGVTGISAQLEAISGTLADSPGSAKTQLDRVRTQARGIVEEARRSISNLRPKTLENGNLITALRASARELTESSVVKLQIDLRGMHRPLPGGIEKNLLRIAQEAIANAVLHGKASHITIGVGFGPERISLSVEDDGEGFEYSESDVPKPDHYGLVGMRERAEQMAGCFALHSAPGRGTRVEVSVPVNP
ncbi:MAG: sensor histidine kinase, partial [Bryobacteraceae bacterium]